LIRDDTLAAKSILQREVRTVLTLHLAR